MDRAQARGQLPVSGARALQGVSRQVPSALQQAHCTQALPRDPATTNAQRLQRGTALRQHDWVVYAKTPLAGPAVVLDYLARYTHRTAIGNERLLNIEEDRVRFRVRADAAGAKRCIALDGQQFVQRLLQHVLPAGFKRIRHYGLLAPAAKTQRLALARKLLAMPEPSAKAREDAQAFMQRVAAIEIARCPHCQAGRWQLLREIGADRQALAALLPTVCRGPP